MINHRSILENLKKLYPPTNLRGQDNKIILYGGPMPHV
jgi:hypothetical protein